MFRLPCATDYRTLLGITWEVLFSSRVKIKHTVLENNIYTQVHTCICITFIWTSHWNTLFHDWSKLHALKFNRKTVLHKEASRFTTGGIERQPSIVVIYWLQSRGVFMTHAHTIRIRLNFERLREHPRERRETPSTPAMLKHSEIKQELHERDKE